MLHTALSVSFLAILSFSSFVSSTNADSESLSTKAESEVTVTEPSQCDRGDSYYDGCDSCKCTPHGYVCVSDRACADSERNLPVPTVSLGRSKRYVYRCRPGSRRQATDCCNTCTCTMEGHWLCSRRWCVAVGCPRNRMRRSIGTLERDNAAQKRQLPYSETDDVPMATSGRRTKRSVHPNIDGIRRKFRPWQCRNGESNWDGCNRCVCSRGRMLCTLRACRRYKPVRANSAKLNRIERDIYTRGRYPSIVQPSTLRPPISPEEKCVSKAHFGRGYYNGCNYCLCYDVGRAVCTKLPCRT